MLNFVFWFEVQNPFHSILGLSMWSTPFPLSVFIRWSSAIFSWDDRLLFQNLCKFHEQKILFPPDETSSLEVATESILAVAFLDKTVRLMSDQSGGGTTLISPGQGVAAGARWEGSLDNSPFKENAARPRPTRILMGSSERNHLTSCEPIGSQDVSWDAWISVTLKLTWFSGCLLGNESYSSSF